MLIPFPRCPPASGRSNLEFARTLHEQLRQAGFRGTVDERSEKIGAKIRYARLDKVPYMLIVGPKEQQEGTVSLRSRAKEDEGTVEWPAFLQRLETEERTKGLCPDDKEEPATTSA